MTTSAAPIHGMASLDRANEALTRAYNLNARMRLGLGFAAPAALPSEPKDTWVYTPDNVLLAWWDESLKTGLIETHPHLPWIVTHSFDEFVAEVERVFPKRRAA
jgi:hypothetical protein